MNVPVRCGMIVDPAGRIGYAPLPARVPAARLADLPATLAVVLLDNDDRPNLLAVPLADLYAHRFGTPAPVPLRRAVGRVLLCRRCADAFEPLAASTAVRVRRLTAGIVTSIPPKTCNATLARLAIKTSLPAHTTERRPRAAKWPGRRSAFCCDGIARVP